MTTIAFWNVQGNDLADELSWLCRDHDIDVLILAEWEVETTSLLLAMNSIGGPTYIEPFNPSSRLKFFTRYPLDALQPIADEGGISVRLLRPPLGLEVLLVGMHLPSKLYQADTDQLLFAARVANVIREAERSVGHSKSLVIGDLNMNPFEHGMVAADCFHAVMDKAIAQQGSRNVQGVEREFFYNPMWSRLGDESPGPPGTYFYRGGQATYFWNTFDQVLLRPSLLPYYAPDSLRVVTSIGGRALLRNARIDRSLSDHLPVLLTLGIEKEPAS